MRTSAKSKELVVTAHAQRMDPSVHRCPSCDKVLSICEFIEHFCHECGAIQPMERRA